MLCVYEPHLAALLLEAARALLLPLPPEHGSGLLMEVRLMSLEMQNLE